MIAKAKLLIGILLRTENGEGQMLVNVVISAVCHTHNSKSRCNYIQREDVSFAVPSKKKKFYLVPLPLSYMYINKQQNKRTIIACKILGMKSVARGGRVEQGEGYLVSVFSPTQFTSTQRKEVNQYINIWTFHLINNSCLLEKLVKGLGQNLCYGRCLLIPKYF